jgi:O-Antigen ligase
LTGRTTRIASSVALIVSIAAAETRIAARAAPGVIHWLAPLVAWGLVSISLGMLIGLAAVVLPPLAAPGIVAAVAVVLLWALPDVRIIAPRILRTAFIIMLITVLCVPVYYTVQLSGLPWISLRRATIFPFVVLFGLSLGSSAGLRDSITERLRSSRLLLLCALGYLAMAILSITTSAGPTLSTSALFDAILTWYVPFFATIALINKREDAISLLKIICYCQILDTMAGIVEFILKHRVYITIFPSDMLNKLIADNPALIELVSSPFRNGLYRAVSIFIAPLSYGELEILVIPIGLFFTLFRSKLWERALGSVVVLFGIAGIFTSGSRGAYLGFIVSIAVFVTLFAIRKGIMSRGSIAPALVGVLGAEAFGALTMLILVSGKVHNFVLGGGETAASNAGRTFQWIVGMPLIESNPITGHGFAMGGALIEQSIDSYALSLLIETGVPGLVFFAGLLFTSMWYGVRNYLSDFSEAGTLSGALVCSVAAFTFYRLVLSQRENHTLLFILLGVLVTLTHEIRKSKAYEQRNYKLDRALNSRAGQRARLGA